MQEVNNEANRTETWPRYQRQNSQTFYVGKLSFVCDAQMFGLGSYEDCFC